MTETVLCERDVLNKLGWPSRRYVDARIRRDSFPRPRKHSHGIGDQWYESDIDRWLGILPEAQNAGEEALLARFQKAAG